MNREQDPKQAAGAKKDQLQLLPPAFLRATAKVLKLGAEKYGEFNWRTSGGVKAQTYVGALLRHTLQYAEGQDMDEESGESHLAHVAATCAVLLDAMAAGQLIDDRHKKVTTRRLEP